MENWTYHEPTVMGFSKHFETDEALPKDLFDKLVAAKNYRSGSATLRQLYFGHLDMELHHRFDPNGDESVSDVKQRVIGETTVVAPLPEDRFENAFGHIFAADIRLATIAINGPRCFRQMHSVHSKKPVWTTMPRSSRWASSSEIPYWLKAGAATNGHLRRVQRS